MLRVCEFESRILRHALTSFPLGLIQPEAEAAARSCLDLDTLSGHTRGTQWVFLTEFGRQTPRNPESASTARDVWDTRCQREP